MSHGVYIFCDSEPYLVKSKEYNNQGIKVQVKRIFKAIPFFLFVKKRQPLLDIFLNPECYCAAGASTHQPPPFQNQCPLILLPPVFQRPGQDQQNGKQRLSLTTSVL